MSEEAEKRDLAAENARLTAQLKAREVRDKLAEHLSDKHKDYVGVEKYIAPAVAIDDKPSEAELARRIAAAAEQFVKDNPRPRTVANKPASASAGSNSMAYLRRSL